MDPVTGFERKIIDLCFTMGRAAADPVPVTRVLDVADAGERMPQKSTFFYPKLPTGLVFNLLED